MTLAQQITLIPRIVPFFHSSKPQRQPDQTLTSVPLPRRLRTRTPRHTPLISAPLPQPLLRAQLQLPIQLRTRLLAVYEIAEAASDAAFAAVQSATRFSEIRHGAEFAVDGSSGVPA